MRASGTNESIARLSAYRRWPVRRHRHRANSGIGLEAARVFAAKGAHVVFAVRDEKRPGCCGLCDRLHRDLPPRPRRPALSANSSVCQGCAGSVVQRDSAEQAPKIGSAGVEIGSLGSQRSRPATARKTASTRTSRSRRAPTARGAGTPGASIQAEIPGEIQVLTRRTPPVRGLVPSTVVADRNRGITRVLGTPRQ